MTQAEALAALRELALRFRADGNAALLGQALETFRDVATYGVDPADVLLIRRFRRLAGDCHAAAAGNGVTH